MNTRGNEVLGLDLGNTIFDKHKNEFPHAIRVIERLASQRFGRENVFVISKVTPEQKIRALSRLREIDFYTRTGMPEDHVEFCAERHEKAPICERLGITHHVDDRPDVMIHLTTVSHKYLFQPIAEHVKRHLHRLAGCYTVEHWLEIERLLIPS
jgi:hypothetical protein